MKIKQPVLIDKLIKEVYEIDVEGTTIVATYTYNMTDATSDGWVYDLGCFYDDLSEDEIEDLEDEFADVLHSIAI
jgi:hypothetical protein